MLTELDELVDKLEMENDEGDENELPCSEFIELSLDRSMLSVFEATFMCNSIELSTIFLAFILYLF